MAKDTQLSTEAVNAEADALARLLDNGYMRIYSGTKPATANTALSGNTLLAELRFAATSAPAAAAGVLTFNGLTADSDADATGTASFARCLKSDGTSAVMDVTVGDSADAPVNVQLNSKAIQIHAQVSVSSFTHTVAKATSGS
jgi:hypothetical protein